MWPPPRRAPISIIGAFAARTGILPKLALTGGLMLALLCGEVSVAPGQTPPVSPAGEVKFVLVGTVVGESRSLAFLQEPSLTGNGVLRVPLGERIGPYRLTKVLGDRVELQGPTGLLTVRLGGMAGGAPSSAPPPPTPPVVTAAPATGPPPPDLIETLPRQMGFGAVLEEAARRAP